MPLPDPNHDQPHLGPRTGMTIDKVDQLSSVVILGLAVIGGLAIVVINLAVGP